MLELGGAVEVVLPASDYRERKVKPDNAAEFDELLGQAKDRAHHALRHVEPRGVHGSQRAPVRQCRHRVAVWDGGPSGGHGGTAEAVDAARDRGLSVTVVWPEAARRK
ncbi:hypothetical protein [Amycolatopsis tucumanensis]|uniref:UspA domain-containing protein n=1 Tax=Amycolatopsis tucumanensis TaxID=401106 RepID=A0ABP7HHS0_9PSEU|nr:hypothetical protein [Amycolatopsis tucumanensis]MCF6429202.1 hypothetical protein [Amycolatopsis tucumanensis]